MKFKVGDRVRDWSEKHNTFYNCTGVICSIIGSVEAVYVIKLHKKKNGYKLIHRNGDKIRLLSKLERALC